MTFNIGDKVYHSVGGIERGIGTIVGFLPGESLTQVIWDEGTARRRDLGDKICSHINSFIRLYEPAMNDYDPTQMGDTEEDI